MDSMHEIINFIIKVLKPIKTLYKKIPYSYRFLSKLINFVIWLYNIVRLKLWIITGEEALSKQNLVIAYAGMEKNKNFWIKLAFNGLHTEKYVGRIWFWKNSDTINKRNYNCSLTVTDLMKAFYKLLRKSNSFFIPSWIDGDVDISEENALLYKCGSIKSDIRKIRKYDLKFEINNEFTQLDNFYYQMYQPYILRIHDDRAFIDPFDLFKEKRNNSDLLLIKRNEEYLAGTLLTYSKNTANLWRLGIKDGNLEYVKDGVIGALFYYSIQYVKEKGYKKVNFGPSRPFLNNGIIQFKMKRGLPIADKSKDGLLIKPLSDNAAVKGFFLNNPFIYINKASLYGAFFIRDDQRFSNEDFERIYKEYYVTGLSKLVIYRIREQNGIENVTIPSEFADKIEISSSESLF